MAKDVIASRSSSGVEFNGTRARSTKSPDDAPNTFFLRLVFWFIRSLQAFSEISSHLAIDDPTYMQSTPSASTTWGAIMHTCLRLPPVSNIEINIPFSVFSSSNPVFSNNPLILGSSPCTPLPFPTLDCFHWSPSRTLKMRTSRASAAKQIYSLISCEASWHLTLTHVSFNTRLYPNSPFQRHRFRAPRIRRSCGIPPGLSQWGQESGRRDIH